jgi:hypothetical protein
MFSAHLLFADLNRHSALPFDQRTVALKKFWNACNKLRPSGVTGSPHSFFDVDNDNLMAGFSEVPGMHSGTDVLKWALKLHNVLAKQGIPISFGADLMAVRRPLEWPTDPGFIANTRRLYIDDELLSPEHSLPRSRIVGDALIVTARLLKLAKATKCTMAFSTFQGGHCPFSIEELKNSLGQVEVLDITAEYPVLEEKAADLESRQVRAYGIKAAV